MGGHNGSQDVFARRRRRRGRNGGWTCLGSICRQCVAQGACKRPLAPSDIESAVVRLRKQFLAEFDPAYVENVIVPYFLMSIYDGERPVLPMIGVELTKENALPYDLWGLLSETGSPRRRRASPSFCKGWKNAARITNASASICPPSRLTSTGRCTATRSWPFFDKLLGDSNAGKPLMRPYLENYFDLYWDLHLGVKGDAVPARVREIGEAFNTVLAYRDVTQKIVYDNYMTVRENLAFLKEWIDDRLADLASGKTPNPEKTFAHYWIKNAGTARTSRTRMSCSRCSTISWRSANGATRCTTSC